MFIALFCLFFFSESTIVTTSNIQFEFFCIDEHETITQRNKNVWTFHFISSESIGKVSIFGGALHAEPAIRSNIWCNFSLLCYFKLQSKHWFYQWFWTETVK